ncbi:MAG: hypothetical protein ABIB12_00885 [Patescibacteria group bacterium]
MDLKAIKDILKHGGGKIVIVEEDRPTFVVFTFEEYLKEMGKVESSPRRVEPAAEESSAEELTIEDLPI